MTVVVFSDFQCPACRVLAESLREIRRRHPGKVAIVYRHYPLPIHAAARAAAGASECAAEQHRFEAYHDALFTAQDTLGRVDWERLARAVGVPDLARFTRCTASAGTSSRIQDDVASAAQLEVRATPTILINGLRLVGAPRLYVLEEMVAREL